MRREREEENGRDREREAAHTGRYGRVYIQQGNHDVGDRGRMLRKGWGIITG